MSSPPTITQLSDESHFDSFFSYEDHISICGFCSLLSERSARSTFPDLLNFRIGVLNHFCCVFIHVAPLFFERDIAKAETMILDFNKREVEFRFLGVLPETLDGKSYNFPAILGRKDSDSISESMCLHRRGFQLHLSGGPSFLLEYLPVAWTLLA